MNGFLGGEDGVIVSRVTYGVITHTSLVCEECARRTGIIVTRVSD